MPSPASANALSTIGSSGLFVHVASVAVLAGFGPRTPMNEQLDRHETAISAAVRTLDHGLGHDPAIEVVAADAESDRGCAQRRAFGVGALRDLRCRVVADV